MKTKSKRRFVFYFSPRNDAEITCLDVKSVIDTVEELMKRKNKETSVYCMLKDLNDLIKELKL